jgi:hypothetical protein
MVPVYFQKILRHGFSLGPSILGAGHRKMIVLICLLYIRWKYRRFQLYKKSNALMLFGYLTLSGDEG